MHPSAVKWDAHRPVRRRKSVTHYSDDNPQTFTTKSTGDAVKESPKERHVTTKKPGKRKACNDVASSLVRLEPPPDNAVVHSAAYQPILPLPLFSWNSQRISTTASLWSDRVVPPAGLAPKGPTWQEVLPTGNTISTASFTLPPPPMTWFALREDDSSYAIAGDAAGCLSLYQLSASARPRMVLRDTRAAHREALLRRPTPEAAHSKSKRTFVSYPNAIVQCAWCRHVILVWTADELELLYLSNTRATSLAVWPLAQFPIYAAAGGGVSKRPGGNHNATTTPCLSIAAPSSSSLSSNHCYRILWTTLATDPGRPTLLQADLSIAESDTVEATESPWSPSLLPNDPPHLSLGARLPWHSLTLEDASPWRCWTALYEAPLPEDSAQGPTLLLLAQTGPDAVELLRTRRSEISTHSSPDATSVVPVVSAPLQILRRQAVPLGRSSNTEVLPGGDYLWPIPDCCLQQFMATPQYTFLCAARGIRMYRTATLEAVALFGDTVQLHGKAAVWSRCAWVPAVARSAAPVRVDASNGPNATVVAAVNKKKQIWWLERSDELAQRELECTERNRASFLGQVEEQEYWLLGVPHPYLGPSELKTSLYLWKPGGVGETTATLHLPAGGCLGDFYVAPECRHMVCVGAESSRLFDWRPILRTDFAGVMYPVGYKVIMDNLEYIEDEDELDEVVRVEETVDDLDAPVRTESTDVLMSTMDPDLAEALRLSLLELQEPATDVAPHVGDVISVLCDKPSEHDDDVWVVPCWPEPTVMDGDDHSATSSPQRGRALSHISLEDAFEDSYLQSLPQTRSVRIEIEVLQQKWSQQQMAVESGAAVSDKTKAKPKRARTANIEALLQSSMDPSLRRQMGLLRGIWAERLTRDPVLPSLLSNVSSEREATSSFVHGASPEEKSLAMELLRLGPSPEVLDRLDKPKVTSTLKNESNNSELNIAEESGSHAPVSVLSLFSDDVQRTHPQRCRACMGRFVLHSCGIREKPIDYDAIARLEKEEREREQEEKQREKEFKRRLAEAKRRELRKQKKIENERKKLEENQQLNMEMDVSLQRTESEADDVVGCSHWDQEKPFPDGNHYSEPRSDQGLEDPSNSEPTDEDNEDNVHIDSAGEEDIIRNGETQANSYSYHGRNAWQQVRQDDEGINHHEVIHIGGTEVNPSTSLHPMDALEALAGLADSMAKPVPVHNIQHNFNSSDLWNTNTTVSNMEGNQFTVKDYDVHGSESHLFGTTLRDDSSSSVGYGISDRYYSGNTAPESVLESLQSDNVRSNVTPISHVDYRDGESCVTKLEPSDTLNQSVSASAPAILPSLHKPCMDSSLDQALILVEMSESAIVHGPSPHHRSPNNSLTTSRTFPHTDITANKYTEQIKNISDDHAQEAEALLAFAFSASPKSNERPTVRLDASWTPQTERRVAQNLYDFSPSSQQSCFGSASTTTHAIVVSQFLQQPMAAGLISVTNGADSGGAVVTNTESADHDAVIEEDTIS